MTDDPVERYLHTLPGRRVRAPAGLPAAVLARLDDDMPERLLAWFQGARWRPALALVPLLLGFTAGLWQTGDSDEPVDTLLYALEALDER